MKISIKFEDDDFSDLERVTLRASCGTTDELASTFASIVSATNWGFDAVVVSMLKYTDGYHGRTSPKLLDACNELLAVMKGNNE